ncbi:MAG: hypothetical protein LBP21_08830 [Synergistaceae bacterium]|jgi:predicted nucleic acid-binding protein|nr:hypothetical protein [Synergistaceae bacterium]
MESQAKIHIQRLILENKLELVVSYVSRFENIANPYITRRDAINNFFSKAKFYIDYNFSENIEKHAESIMESGIKEKDALHIACTIEGKCQYLITTDDRGLKYSSLKIKICNPIDFLRELEGIEDA